MKKGDSMQKLYLDCDGVILDTIKKSYEMIEERKLINEEEVSSFYKNINWDELIIISGEIDNSISKIKVLSNYFDIEILTHVYSSTEENSKKKYFAKVLPNINVIAVPKHIDKCDMVDPKDAILVDDFYPNLYNWQEKGGISVKFSNSDKKYDCITITNLLDLLKIDFKIRE